MNQNLICMAHKELSRYDIIKNLLDGEINGSEAALQIGVSIRHIRRLKKKVDEKGIEALAHGNRGRNSNRRIDIEIIKKAKKYLKKNYADFKPLFASEKLSEIHDINLSSEKVRQIMTEDGLWKPKPRKGVKKKYSWRARKENFGEMQQFDGCYHYWLEDRLEEELCLLLSVDDATGKITHGKFNYNEGTKPVFDFWLEYFEKNGLPLSIYLDKFSTYKINHKNAVDNSELITQFERAMNQVGVKPITAHSPQAKGRVERMFETLQDRLIKEMRLAGISKIEQANEFLKKYIPKFNAKFAVVPSRKADLHKKINKTLEPKLPQIFSVQDQRIVHNDYTVMFKTQYFQLDQVQPNVNVYKKDKVIIEEHLNGEIKINLKNHYLKYIVLPERPKKEINIKLPALTKNKQPEWKPPANHPWRNQIFFKKRLLNQQTISASGNSNKSQVGHF